MREKKKSHQKDLCHVIIDFKKASDKVCHAVLWVTMKKYNISANLIQAIKHLYDKAVLFYGSIEDWFRTTIGVRQGCLLSSNLFKTFLERITTDALEDHEGTVSIGGRTITNLRFAVGIYGLAGEEEGRGGGRKLVERFDKASTAHGKEISAEKTKLMTNSTSGINKEIK